MHYLKSVSYQRRLFHCGEKKRERKKEKYNVQNPWEAGKKIGKKKKKQKKFRGRGREYMHRQYSLYQKHKSMVDWSTCITQIHNTFKVPILYSNV